MADAQAVAVDGFNIPPQGGAAPAPAAQPPGGLPGLPAQPAPVPQPQFQPAPPAPPAPAPVPQGAPVSLPVDGGNDPVLRSMTELFMSVGAGLDLNRAIGNAIQHGNPALIDNAYIAEKGGASAAQLAVIAKSLVERVQHQSQAAVSAAHTAAGGADQWVAASTAFNASAPAHLKAVVGQMLESGNPGAVQSAAQMVVDFAKQGGLVPTNAGLIGSGAGPNAAQALDKAAFQEALRKLDPNAKDYLKQRDDVFYRRQLGKNIGKN